MARDYSAMPAAPGSARHERTGLSVVYLSMRNEEAGLLFRCHAMEWSDNEVTVQPIAFRSRWEAENGPRNLGTQDYEKARSFGSVKSSAQLLCNWGGHIAVVAAKGYQTQNLEALVREMDRATQGHRYGLQVRFCGGSQRQTVGRAKKVDIWPLTATWTDCEDSQMLWASELVQKGDPERWFKEWNTDQTWTRSSGSF